MLCFVVLLSSLLILGEGEVGDLLLGHSNQSGNGSGNLADPVNCHSAGSGDTATSILRVLLLRYREGN